MKSVLFTLLFSLPLLAFGQFGLEVGFATFTSDLDYYDSANPYYGFYGQANFKTENLGFNLGMDIHSDTDEAIAVLRLGAEYSIAISDAVSINPGVKLASYGIAWGVNTTESHLGFAPGVNFNWMFSEKLGLVVGLDYNILFEGEYDGYTVPGFTGLSSRAGLKFNF